MEHVTSADETGLCVVSCSNLIPLKRVDYIIKAVSMLPENTPVSWHHFGDGILRAELEEKAAQMFAEKKNVSWTFHGSVPNDTLNRWYDEIGAQLFVTTSSTEGGAPVSMQEAFAMGIPAIGTSVGGIPELIENGVNGYLLSQNPTAEEICDALNRFIGLSAKERAEMSAAAYRMWQKKCDARANAERFTEMLRSHKA